MHQTGGPLAFICPIRISTYNTQQANHLVKLFDSTNLSRAGWWWKGGEVMADIISEREEEGSYGGGGSQGGGGSEGGKGEVSRSTSNLTEALHGGRPKVTSSE